VIYCVYIACECATYRDARERTRLELYANSRDHGGGRFEKCIHENVGMHGVHGFIVFEDSFGTHDIRWSVFGRYEDVLDWVLHHG
jgi:hypothetical protein